MQVSLKQSTQKVWYDQHAKIQESTARQVAFFVLKFLGLDSWSPTVIKARLTSYLVQLAGGFWASAGSPHEKGRH